MNPDRASHIFRNHKQHDIFCIKFVSVKALIGLDMLPMINMFVIQVVGLLLFAKIVSVFSSTHDVSQLVSNSVLLRYNVISCYPYRNWKI